MTPGWRQLVGAEYKSKFCTACTGSPDVAGVWAHWERVDGFTVCGHFHRPEQFPLGERAGAVTAIEPPRLFAEAPPTRETPPCMTAADLRALIDRHEQEVLEGTPPHRMAWHPRHAQAHEDRRVLLNLLRRIAKAGCRVNMGHVGDCFFCGAALHNEEPHRRDCPDPALSEVRPALGLPTWAVPTPTGEGDGR